MEETNGKKHRKAEEKYQIVKDHLISKRQVSETCDKYKIHTNNLYRWMDEFFAGALEGMKNRKTNRQKDAEARREERLKEEIRKKDQIIAEVVAENLEVKKNLLES